DLPSAELDQTAAHEQPCETVGGGLLTQPAQHLDGLRDVAQHDRLTATTTGTRVHRRRPHREVMPPYRLAAIADPDADTTDTGFPRFERRLALAAPRGHDCPSAARHLAGRVQGPQQLDAAGENVVEHPPASPAKLRQQLQRRRV